MVKMMLMAGDSHTVPRVEENNSWLGSHGACKDQWLQLVVCDAHVCDLVVCQPSACSEQRQRTLAADTWTHPRGSAYDEQLNDLQSIAAVLVSLKQSKSERNALLTAQLY